MVDDAGWGNATYASYDIIRTYDPAETDRRHYTVTTYGEFYPEFNKKNGGYTVGVTEVDDNAYKKRCHVKKHVLGKFDDNGVSYKQSSGVNTYMMRLAEGSWLSHTRQRRIDIRRRCPRVFQPSTHPRRHACQKQDRLRRHPLRAPYRARI